MLLTLALCAVASLRVDAPLVVTAQAPASSQETILVPWAGVRAAFVDHDGGGLFVGGEGQLLVGVDSQGTNEVAVTSVPVLLEGRGLLGSRWRPGGATGAGFGGYGYGGLGVGAGAASLTVFDETRVRPFALWTARGGAGLEISFGPATTRVELGLGLRDLRFELHGSFAIGGVF